MITAEPFSIPCCGSKMVIVGVSWQASPFAWGAGPDHSRMVSMPRNALFCPGVAQIDICARAGKPQPIAKPITRKNNRLIETPVNIRGDYTGRAEVSDVRGCF